MKKAFRMRCWHLLALTTLLASCDVGAITDAIDDSTREQITFSDRTFEVDEGATSIGTLEASVTGSGSVSFSAASAVFSVSPGGRITLQGGQELDFEVNDHYEFDVTASASSADDVTRRITVLVRNVDEGEDDEVIIRGDAARSSVIESGEGGCTYGGILVESGTDANSNGQLDDNEVEVMTAFCNGGAGEEPDAIPDAAVLRTVEIAPGDEGCPYGGTLVQTGVDSNGNGVLDDSEVNSEQALCNGAVTLIFEAQSFTVAENLAVGTVIGTLAFSASDGSEVSLELVETRPVTDIFTISGNALHLTASFDGTITEYVLVVRASSPTVGVEGVVAEITVEVAEVFGNTITLDAAAQDLGLPEDAAAGDVAGTLVASGEEVTFAATDALFVVSSAGEVALAAGASLDYETATSHGLQVTVSGLDAEDITATVTIEVANVLENSITLNAAAQGLSLPEDAQAGAVAGTLVASGEEVTFAATDALFVVSSAGEVTLAAGASLDYETATSHGLQVTVSGLDAEDLEVDVFVAVTDVTRSIDFSSQTLSIAENVPSGSSAGSLQASVSGGGEVAFSVEDATFAVGTSTGEVTLQPGASLDYESQAVYTFSVTASAEEALSVSTVIIVSVTDVSYSITLNEPTFTSPESIAEGAVVGVVVGSISAGGGPISYSTTSDTFDVDDNGILSLKSGAALDFETKPEHQVLVTATAADAAAVTTTVTVNVTDVSYSLNFPSQTFTTSENLAAGIPVGTLSASIPHSATVSFAANDSLFQVSESGEITLQSGAALDYETATSHSFDVTASAADADDATATVTITVTNVLENDITFAAQTRNVPEDSNPGVPLGTLTASVSPAGSVSFSNTDTLFSVSSGGVIALKSGQSLNFEAAETHTLTVTVTAPDAESTTAVVTITVTNVLENSITFTAQTFTVPENITVDELIGTLTASVLPAGSILFSSADTLFDVRHDGTIFLQLGQSLDYETTETHTLAATATAPDAEAVTATITVNVTNIQGTPEDPYQVDSFEELQSIGTGFSNDFVTTPLTLFESLSAHYILTANIDASVTGSGTYLLDDKSDLDPGNDEHGFMPIGTCGTDNTCSTSGTFNGSFDGNGYVISGLSIERVNLSYAGLFGQISISARLYNLALEGLYIRGKDYIGGLVGRSDGALISDSYVSGVIGGSGNRVGGLVGENDEGTVQNSYTAGSVNGSGSRIGGLIGDNKGAVEYGFATGSVSGGSDVGGLVGYSSGTVTDSFALGGVSSSGQYSGGLVGWNSGGTIESSYATGSVTGSGAVGGLIGHNSNSGTVTDSFATGAVSGTLYRVGGLVGYSDGTIESSFATGAVSGALHTGGLIGYNGGTVTGSFATGTVSSSSGQVGGLIGIHQGTAKHSFATGTVSSSGSYVGGLIGNSGGTVAYGYALGNASGTTNVGGLAGYNHTGHTITDSYSLGAASGTTNVGGLVGDNRADIARAYYNSGVNGALVGSNTGTVTDTAGKTEAELQALPCGESALFRWDDPDDNPDAGLVDCSVPGAAAFPWHFGETDEFPVLQNNILRPAGQRALLTEDIDFSSLDATPAAGASVSIDAASLVTASEGFTLEYYWLLPADIVDATFSADGRVIAFTAPAADTNHILGLVIIERDGFGNIERIYSDSITVRVS